MTLVEQEVVECPAVPVFPELIRAAEIIRERGWYQGDYYEGCAKMKPYRGGAVCVLGALGLACSDDPEGWNGDLACRLTDAIGVAGGISRWSDAPERTQDEVIELLERTGYGL